jgi:hypothetical protein
VGSAFVRLFYVYSLSCMPTRKQEQGAGRKVLRTLYMRLCNSKVHLASGWIKYTLGLGSQLNWFFFFVGLGNYLCHAQVRRKKSRNERLVIESIELSMLKYYDIIEPLIGRLYLSVTSVLPRHQNCGRTVPSHAIELYIKLSTR